MSGGAAEAQVIPGVSALRIGAALGVMLLVPFRRYFVAEMNGKPLAALLGVLQALAQIITNGQLLEVNVLPELFLQHHQWRTATFPAHPDIDTAHALDLAHEFATGRHNVPAQFLLV